MKPAFENCLAIPCFAEIRFKINFATGFSKDLISSKNIVLSEPLLDLYPCVQYKRLLQVHKINCTNVENKSSESKTCFYQVLDKTLHKKIIEDDFLNENSNF